MTKQILWAMDINGVVHQILCTILNGLNYTLYSYTGSHLQQVKRCNSELFCKGMLVVTEVAILNDYFF